MSGKERKDEDNKPELSTWTPEAVENLIRLVDSLVKNYVQFKREDSEAKLKRLEAVGKHNRRLVYWMVGFLVAVIISTGALTSLGKVSGDALLFLAGTITGYIIILIQQFIESPIEDMETIKS